MVLRARKGELPIAVGRVSTYVLRSPHTSGSQIAVNLTVGLQATTYNILPACELCTSIIATHSGVTLIVQISNAVAKFRALLHRPDLTVMPEPRNRIFCRLSLLRSVRCIPLP